MNILNKGRWNQDVGNTSVANTSMTSFPHITGIHYKAQERSGEV